MYIPEQSANNCLKYSVSVQVTDFTLTFYIFPLHSLNNCILADLAHGTSRAPGVISRAVKKVPDINANQRQKKLSCRPMLEFIALLYTYNLTVSEKVKYHRTQELKQLFFERMPEKKAFFQGNDLIKSNYEFCSKVIRAFFP